MAMVPIPIPLVAQPLVSIVTPVYNGEKFLAECIESVLAQTYEHWEYVIVDNCSTDASAKIALRYAQKDPRIRVKRAASFLPVIENWNRAVREISPDSKYCKVLCADDVLFPDCLMKMVHVCEENESVGIVGAYRLCGSDVDLDALPYTAPVVPGPEICRHSLLGGRYVFGTPTSILIRSELIRAREAFFNESNPHADTEACYDVLRESDFGFVHQVLNFTRVHEDSLTRRSTGRIGTWRPETLLMLLRYGPVYLAPDEFRRRVRTMARRYLILLIKGVVKLKPWRDREFRTYHAQALGRLAEAFSTRRQHAWLWDLLGACFTLMGPGWKGPRRSAFAGRRAERIGVPRKKTRSPTT